ncbi:MAG: heavy-metal-associated domain-containing protein [Ginsengibacter sp.]
MTTHQIFVENIKCSGCINSIKTILLKRKGVIAVVINKEENKVCVSGIAIERNDLVMKLATLGYPERGNNNLISKVKSFVNCAVGMYDKIK